MILDLNLFCQEKKKQEKLQYLKGLLKVNSMKIILKQQVIKNYLIFIFFQTLGADFGIKIIESNEKKVKIQLWDSAGKKNYKISLKTFLKKSNAILLVYDVTNESSFAAIKDWMEEIKKDENVNKQIIALVAQKCDLNERIISEEKGKELANELGVEYFEVSAKTGDNVEEMFNHLIQKCISATNEESADIGSK